MDVTIKELIVKQETIEKDQARYNVESSIKYRIKDVMTSAETYTNDEELKQMLIEVVQSSVRAVTVEYNVEDARAKKLEIETKIRSVIDKDIKAWGIEMVSFQLVNFEDTEDSSIISDISRRREVEISARTREENAEKEKTARVKEAKAEEEAKQSEIAKDQLIAEREQKKKEMVAIKEKVAKEKEYEVIQVATIKQAEIDKEKAEVEAEQMKAVAIIKANEEKEAETINKDKKQLEGEGDRARAEEQAKGQSAPIREKGKAEAEIIEAKGRAEAVSKDKLQEALNKFDDKAIQALVAEKVVAKDEAIGVATANALTEADIKILNGSDNKGGFDLSKMLASMSLVDDNATDMLKNRMARPNDLGMTALVGNQIGKKMDEAKNKTKKVKEVKETTEQPKETTEKVGTKKE